MPEFYHYTHERHIAAKQRGGVFPDHPYFTTTEYFSSQTAGQAVGVMAHNISHVLKFKDDGHFRRSQDIPGTGRFVGGGNQYSHPIRPKPIAKRGIGDRAWTLV